MLNSVRGRIKACLTRLGNLINDLNLKNDILIRILKLDELYKESDKLDFELDEKYSEIEEFQLDILP